VRLGVTFFPSPSNSSMSSLLSLGSHLYYVPKVMFGVPGPISLLTSAWTWFFKNVSRKDKAEQSAHFRNVPIVIQMIWNSAWVGAGLWVYPIPKTIPLIALLGGVFSRIYFPQPSHKNGQSRNELLRKR